MNRITVSTTSIDGFHVNTHKDVHETDGPFTVQQVIDVLGLVDSDRRCDVITIENKEES